MRVVELWACGVAKLEGGVVDVDAEETRVRSCRGEEVAREGCGDIVSHWPQLKHRAAQVGRCIRSTPDSRKQGSPEQHDFASTPRSLLFTSRGGWKGQLALERVPTSGSSDPLPTIIPLFKATSMALQNHPRAHFFAHDAHDAGHLPGTSVA